MTKIIKCICGNHNAHSNLCKRHNKKLYQLNYNRNKRAQQRRDHICLSCGKKVKPDKCPHCNEILGYKKRCKSCLTKSNISVQKCLDKKNNRPTTTRRGEKGERFDKPL